MTRSDDPMVAVRSHRPVLAGRKRVLLHPGVHIRADAGPASPFRRARSPASTCPPMQRSPRRQPPFRGRCWWLRAGGTGASPPRDRLRPSPRKSPRSVAMTSS